MGGNEVWPIRFQIQHVSHHLRWGGGLKTPRGGSPPPPPLGDLGQWFEATEAQRSKVGVLSLGKISARFRQFLAILGDSWLFWSIEPRTLQDEPRGLQNRAWDPPRRAPGPAKSSPEPPKTSPGASKNEPGGLQDGIFKRPLS